MTKDQVKAELAKAQKEMDKQDKAIRAIQRKFASGPAAEYARTIKAALTEKCNASNKRVKKGPGKVWCTKSAGSIKGISGSFGLHYATSYYTNYTWWGHNGKKAKAFTHGAPASGCASGWANADTLAKNYAKAGLPKPKPVKDEKCLLKEEIAKLRKDIAKLGKRK